MAGSSVVPGEERRGLFEQMMAFTERPWFVLSASLVSPTQSAPTRETVVNDYMAVPTYTPFKDADGKSWMGEPRYPTRDEAERAAGSYRLAIGEESAA